MAVPDRVAAHVFVADLDAPALDGADRHHLERVLRLRPGETVTVSDGRGGRRRCVLAGGMALEAAGPLESVPRPEPGVTVAFAVPKGDRPEWVVQKLTEAGVDRIVPMVTARSVVRWDAGRSGRHVERLRRVAREAAMQCRRVWLPDVGDLVHFDAFADRAGAALAEAGGEPPSLERPIVLIGPEGGWADDERNRGMPLISLGDHVLRTETAAVVAGVLLCALRAGLVTPAGEKVWQDPR